MAQAVKRNANRQSRAETFDNRPKWLSEYGRRELEGLVCESTLGGCGHSFMMHGSVQLSNGRSVVYCGACNTQADKYVEARRRELAKLPSGAWEITASEILNIRRMNSCHEFVTGVVTHVDFEKLFRDLERGTDVFGERKTKQRVSKDERKSAKQAALDLLHRRKPSESALQEQKGDSDAATDAG